MHGLTNECPLTNQMSINILWHSPDDFQGGIEDVVKRQAANSIRDYEEENTEDKVHATYQKTTQSI